MSGKLNRRRFLETLAAAGIGSWVLGGTQAQASQSANERVAVACVGLGGVGAMDSSSAKRYGDVVAICDVDRRALQTAERTFPQAKKYTDYRKMLDKMEKSIDAVTISTPDHPHAAIALKAMRMGKHCYCQTPLAHSIYEARLMGKVAKKQGVVTQMADTGTGWASQAISWLLFGTLGTVREVHVWTSVPVWPQGATRSEPSEPPKSLKWDLWLGPAPERPYTDDYHPLNWRGWWDFGTGALGDRGCQFLNLAFLGLNLRNPVAVQARTDGHNKDSYPRWSIITYEFAATERRPELKLYWYDGGKQPDRELFGGEAPTRDGALIIGDKAKLYEKRRSPHFPFAEYKILGDVDVPKGPRPRPTNHVQGWFDAMQTGESAASDFSTYAAPLTEVVLLGNLAAWLAANGEGERIEWDPNNMQAGNVDGLEPLIKPTYRDGYLLDA